MLSSPIRSSDALGGRAGRRKRVGKRHTIRATYILTVTYTHRPMSHTDTHRHAHAHIRTHRHAETHTQRDTTWYILGSMFSYVRSIGFGYAAERERGKAGEKVTLFITLYNLIKQCCRASTHLHASTTERRPNLHGRAANLLATRSEPSGAVQCGEERRSGGFARREKTFEKEWGGG